MAVPSTSELRAELADPYALTDSSYDRGVSECFRAAGVRTDDAP